VLCAVQPAQPTPVRPVQDDVEIETRTEQSDAFAVRSLTPEYSCLVLCLTGVTTARSTDVSSQ